MNLKIKRAELSFTMPTEEGAIVEEGPVPLNCTLHLIVVY